MIIKMEFKDITDKRLLAKFLGIKYKELTYILYSKRTENLYQTFEIPKKNGKMRCINAPQEPLKYVQRNLAKQLISIQEKYYLETNNIIQGFTKKRDIISNGSYHRNKRYILKIKCEYAKNTNKKNLFLIFYSLQRATSCPLCSPERPQSCGGCRRGALSCRFQYLEALRGSTQQDLKRRGWSSPHAHGQPLFRIFPSGAPLLNLNVEGDVELLVQRQTGFCKAGGCAARQNGDFK